MTMSLRVLCSALMLQLAFVVGDDPVDLADAIAQKRVVGDDITNIIEVREDDFTTCSAPAACAAWKTLADGPTKIVIKDKTWGGDVQYYRIDVTYGDEGRSFSKLRRYSEFANLRKSLGLDDAAQDVAPFPPKLYLNSIVQALWPQTMQDRSAQLEVWLQAVVAHKNSKEMVLPWPDELFAFLDPKHAANALSSGISMPPDANKICRTLTWPVTSDKHYFGIDVNTGSDKPDRVWRRYSDFHALNATLGSIDEELATAFPAKLYWNRLIPMWEGKLEERRRSLEAWLRKAKLHPNFALGGVWAEEMNKFLDPVENEKLDKDCFLEKVGEATYSEMEKFYVQMKEKIDELTKEKIENDELTIETTDAGGAADAAEAKKEDKEL